MASGSAEQAVHHVSTASPMREGANFEGFQISAPKTKKRDRRERMGKKQSSEFLTRRQVADILGLSSWALIYWRRKKVGPPSIRMNRGTVRYPRKEFDAWLAALPRS